MEVIEGTPDLGITSYWTDAEGNVVYSPNTPEEKMKTPVTGTKTQKRKGERAGMRRNIVTSVLVCLLMIVLLQTP